MSEAASLLDYYRKNRFNPVPIDLATPEALSAHAAKRRTLYSGHLGIPLGLLSGQKVLEFGCNSGENAVVLALCGADLTLVEPNEQVHQRLRDVFEAFGLGARLEALSSLGIDEFPEDRKYNVVLAEGFLFALPNKAELAAKICRLLTPGGIGVISFNCRFGGLIELHKRLALYRACELAGADFRSEQSLAIAQELYGAAFARISASRPFAAWWKDLLVNPFYADRYLWSYGELLPVLAAAGAEFLSTSPRWFEEEPMRWYKNVPAPGARNAAVMEQWRGRFGGMLTGKPAQPGFEAEGMAGPEVVAGVETLALGISDYTEGLRGLDAVRLDGPLAAWLRAARDPNLAALCACLTAVHQALALTSAEDFRAAVAGSGLAGLWGSAYHYLSFTQREGIL
ncbi:MAG: methyltransferase domain-containing protein [Desulfovibrio sp.]|nr:methyltransferase domain-containing protein [Desulfovibrio sp.]